MGVAMGSPLGPVIANIFMSQLETELIPELSGKLSVWFRYVDDTFTFLREGDIHYIKSILNGFHQNIKFTHEIEIENQLSFLDVKIKRNSDNHLNTSVFRKETDTNVYVHWKAHAPKSWKIGTLKGLFRRAFVVSSSDINLKNEIEFLENIFVKVNKYPKLVVQNTLKSVKDKISEERTVLTPPVVVDEQGTSSTTDEEQITFPHIILPYNGFNGETVIKKFKKVLRDSLPKNVIPRFVYKGKKLGTLFPIKDKVSDKHRSKLIYGYHIPGRENETFHYIGESKVRHETRVNEHISTDKNSSVYKHSHENNYNPNSSNFTILAQGYDNWLDRRICEALFVKDYKPILNKQKISHKLELFS